jgi:hypothetical protein
MADEPVKLWTEAVRLNQIILIGSTLLASWLGLQAVHEFGHVLGTWLTGGQVAKVVLHPLTISRTDITDNPHPLVVVWAGPVIGIVIPLLLWWVASVTRMPGAYVPRFFAAFCLVANGLYIGLGSFNRVGDCGEMLRHGSEPWQLWLFGALTVPTGLFLWHGQGHHFGIGRNGKPVDQIVAHVMLATALALLALAFVVDGM